MPRRNSGTIRYSPRTGLDWKARGGEWVPEEWRGTSELLSHFPLPPTEQLQKMAALSSRPAYLATLTAHVPGTAFAMGKERSLSSRRPHSEDMKCRCLHSMQGAQSRGEQEIREPGKKRRPSESACKERLPESCELVPEGGAGRAFQESIIGLGGRGGRGQS